MSVPSYSSAAPRRIPQQKRGKRRVSGFLRAAACVIAERGYERATMSAIAERAHSCIGSLYQFPNKHSVVEALRDEYVKEIEQSWLNLGREAASLSAEDLTCRLIKLHVEIIKSHPALLALLDVPSMSQKRRQLVRARIAEVLIAHKPRMSRMSASRVAAVIQQVSKAMLTLYAQAGVDEKNAMIEEFKSVLSAYLVPKLKC